MNETTSALGWRYATKRFISNKKIPSEALQKILESARLAPSSYGLQPYHLFVIEDSGLREKLRLASWDQPQITECSHLVVIQARKKIDAAYIGSYIDLVSKTRDIPVDALRDFRNAMLGTVGKNPESPEIQEWAKRQSYIALGFLLLTAAQLQVDACPMEGVEGPKYDDILGTAGSEFQTVAVAALGYRSPEDETQAYKKVRLPRERFFTFR